MVGSRKSAHIVSTIDGYVNSGSMAAFARNVRSVSGEDDEHSFLRALGRAKPSPRVETEAEHEEQEGREEQEAAPAGKRSCCGDPGRSPTPRC